MGFLKIFDTSELEKFAESLAADFTRRFPPTSEARTDMGAQNQLKVVLQGLGTRATRFRDQHNLGLYGKAKLANVFKWKLKDAGYSESFVQSATKDLATRLALKSPSQ